MHKHITVSAPGKLMLLGEHAVVYNHPCIVTAVDQRMRATIESINIPEFHLEAPDVRIAGYRKSLSEIGKGDIPQGARFVEIAIKNIVHCHPELLSGSPGFKIITNSEFSSQFGFGSSSAATVCVVKAISELYNVSLTNQELFDISFKTVLDIQGKGSGFDVAAAIYGRTIYFITGGKVIEPLPVKNIPLVVGYSGIKADTVTVLNKVQETSKKYPEIINAIYTAIEKVVEQAKLAIILQDWQTVGELMNINQGYLEALGVSTKKLATMIYAVKDAGAYGAKLSGAGGGDCMIALTDKEEEEAIANAITSANGKILKVHANAEGVRVEP